MYQNHESSLVYLVIDPSLHRMTNYTSPSPLTFSPYFSFVLMMDFGEKESETEIFELTNQRIMSMACYMAGLTKW